MNTLLYLCLIPLFAGNFVQAHHRCSSKCVDAVNNIKRAKGTAESNNLVPACDDDVQEEDILNFADGIVGDMRSNGQSQIVEIKKLTTIAKNYLRMSSEEIIQGFVNLSDWLHDSMCELDVGTANEYYNKGRQTLQQDCEKLSNANWTNLKNEFGGMNWEQIRDMIPDCFDDLWEEFYFTSSDELPEIYELFKILDDNVQMQNSINCAAGDCGEFVTYMEDPEVRDEYINTLQEVCGNFESVSREDKIAMVEGLLNALTLVTDFMDCACTPEED